MQNVYERTLRWSLDHGRVILVRLRGEPGGHRRCCSMIMPQDFLPSRTSGMIQATTEAANGTVFPTRW